MGPGYLHIRSYDTVALDLLPRAECGPSSQTDSRYAQAVPEDQLGVKQTDQVDFEVEEERHLDSAREQVLVDHLLVAADYKSVEYHNASFLDYMLPQVVIQQSSLYGRVFLFYKVKISQ